MAKRRKSYALPEEYRRKKLQAEKARIDNDLLEEDLRAKRLELEKRELSIEWEILRIFFKSIHYCSIYLIFSQLKNKEHTAPNECNKSL